MTEQTTPTDAATTSGPATADSAASTAPVRPRSTNRLVGHDALVTGAASGIGRQVAARFAAEGARVVVADRDGDGAERAAEEMRAAGGQALAVVMDITDEDSVAAGYVAAADAGYKLDVVVANAGVQLFGQDAQIADLDLEVWRRTVEVNFTGTFLTLKYAVRALLEREPVRTGEFGPGVRGSIIVTGSPTGLNGEGKDFTAYSSTKAGGHGMARAVAAAYADRGIRVNVVVPGYTETPLVTSISGNAEDRAAIVGRTPLGRPGTPADVEGIMVYLASDESSYATGAIFKVEGGMTSL